MRFSLSYYCGDELLALNINQPFEFATVRHLFNERIPLAPWKRSTSGSISQQYCLRLLIYNSTCLGPLSTTRRRRRWNGASYKG